MTCYKSITNKYFLLETKNTEYNFSEDLKKIYEEIFIEYVSKNVLYERDT